MFYATPIGQPCERHKTLPEHDEPCWPCESEAACRYCGETDPKLRSVCGCYDEDACRAREHRREGAAVMAGIIALGTWASRGPLVVKRDYWTSERDGRRYYTCTCRGCGCQLKHRDADEDEGTDHELCGVCYEHRR